jgi:type II secretion system protein C
VLCTLALLAALAAAPADLALLGVVTGERPESRVAILRAQGRTRLVGLGESAFGGRVVSIDVTSVTLDYAGEPLTVRLPAEAAARAAAPAPTPAPNDAGKPPEDPATPARTLSRKTVEARLSAEIPRILAETTIVPVTEDGRVVGFSVTRIPDGSLLGEAGLRAGDVLTRVNDVPIDSLATLIGLWPKLQGADHLSAVVLRNGHPVSLAVTLK